MEANLRSIEQSLAPVKKQYAQAKDWVSERSPMQLVLLIVGPLLVLSIIGFAIYRVFAGGAKPARSRTRTPTKRAARSRARTSRVGLNSRRRNGVRTTVASA